MEETKDCHRPELKTELHLISMEVREWYYEINSPHKMIPNKDAKSSTCLRMKSGGAVWSGTSAPSVSGIQTVAANPAVRPPAISVSRRSPTMMHWSGDTFSWWHAKWKIAGSGFSHVRSPLTRIKSKRPSASRWKIFSHWEREGPLVMRPILIVKNGKTWQ